MKSMFIVLHFDRFLSSDLSSHPDPVALLCRMIRVPVICYETWGVEVHTPENDLNQDFLVRIVSSWLIKSKFHT